MAWARYDDELPINRKVCALRARGVNGIAALGLHVLANTWSRNQGTGGHVADYMFEDLAGKAGPKLADMLLDVGMLDPCGEHAGCLIVHDFDDYSDPDDDGRPAAEKRRDLSAKRAAAGSKGGQAKAANALANGKQTPSKSVALLQQTPSPVPVPVATSRSLATSTVGTRLAGIEDDRNEPPPEERRHTGGGIWTDVRRDRSA